MFNKVAVIGAGTMGAGIAGQVANAGIEVLLLDLPGDGEDVNATARRGLERLKNPDQPGLMSADVENLIVVGNIRDDLARVSECDWIAEAVVERLDIKHALYADIAKHIKSDAILTSNTSTIPIRLLTEGMSDDLRKRFAITHFFNPVRFMRLLELVRGEDTDPEIMQRLGSFSEEMLGKGVVDCADTPGFLANRVGCFAIQCALNEAFKMNLSPQLADAVFGRPMGIPKTGVFGLYDLIGIDLMADVAISLTSILPAGDAFFDVAQPLPLMTKMIENDQRGNKSGQGFYKESASGEKLVMDLQSGQYQLFDRPSIPVADQAEREGIRCLMDSTDQYGQYAWNVMSRTLCYAASLIPEVGNDPGSIDDAMKLGYNWIKGPFELIDEYGAEDFVARLHAEGRQVPEFLVAGADDSDGFYRVANSQYQRRIYSQENTPNWLSIDHGAGVNRFTETRNTLQVEAENEAASWFVYRDIALVEFHTKANALDGDSMAILEQALDAAPERGLKGLIVHNDAQHFSCGVNLGAVRGFYEQEDYDGLDNFLNHFQQTCLRLSRAPFPVVVAPVGMSIGGGFEVVLHGQYVVAHSNAVMGLVESLVGLLPGGGGCKEMLYRWVEKLGCSHKNIEKAAWKAFMNTGYGRTATSPVLAKDLAMLRDRDSYEMNRDRVLESAVALIESGAESVQPSRPQLTMPGRDVYKAMGVWLDNAHEKGMLTPHDTVVGRAIAAVMSGGDIDPGTVWTEQDLYDEERRQFLILTKTEATRARIASMLDLGKTLRN
ncbi:MAG: 3-hydroxyacyl-CoA dehydrogenase [Parasphingorhabdus sp.]|jgi:3-hydroxyacyl-CoA dehydrogenase